MITCTYNLPRTHRLSFDHCKTVQKVLALTLAGAQHDVTYLQNIKKYFISVHLLILTLILIAFDQLFLLALLKT